MESNLATVKINGKEITVHEGTLILDAARDVGFEIPTFCYQADLMGLGSCRMCLVEIEGQRKLQPSCITPVLHGMSIQTESPTVVEARAGVLEFLLSNHALDCPVCDKGGECELQDMVHRHGPHSGRHAEKKLRFHDKDYILSPVIVKNSNRCVQCMKCVRVCTEVVGRSVLGALGRGAHQEETSFVRSFLDCDQDGNCIEVCPVGCFMRLPYRYKTRPWDLKGADTICPWCATGCRMVVEERGGEVIRSRAQLGVGLNSETLCARGRFGYDFINSADRITRPMIKKYGSLEPVSWQEAFEFIKDNLGSISGERIGGVVSARLTNEELYLFGKLFKEVFKSRNVDSSSRWDPASVEAFISATDMTGGGVSVFDCMASDTVLVVGTQLSEENPVTDYIVRRISNTRNMNVVVASTRAMKLDSSANLSIRHMPGTEGELLGAAALSLIADNPEKASAVKGLRSIREKGVKKLLEIADIKEGEVKDLAGRLASSKSISIMAGTGFLRYPWGLSGLNLIKDVLKALGKKVTILPVLDRCNQRGAWEMGVTPGLAPGYGPVEKRGLGAHAMVEAAGRGEVEAMYVIGDDLVTEYPDEGAVRGALARLKFLVVQDIFLTDTAKMADCVLPGSSFVEKDGTVTNHEGRCQIIRRLFPPPGKARADLEIIGGVGRAFSVSFAPDKVTRSYVFEEIRKEVPMYSGVSLAFNNKKNTENKLDNRAALIKASEFMVDFKPVGAVWAGGGAPEEEYPFRLVTGNHLFGSGKSSARSHILTSLLKGPFVEISEEDASVLGLSSGEMVRVRGRHFEAVLSLKTLKGSKQGVAFIPENFPDVPAARFFRPAESVPCVSITRA